MSSYTIFNRILTVEGNKIFVIGNDFRSVKLWINSFMANKFITVPKYMLAYLMLKFAMGVLVKFIYSCFPHLHNCLRAVMPHSGQYASDCDCV